MAACGGQSIPLPGTTALLDHLPRVDNSPDAPCWQQVQIAAQNSYLAGIKQGKEVVYKAPCQVKPKDQKVAAKPMMLGHPDLVVEGQEDEDAEPTSLTWP